MNTPVVSVIIPVYNGEKYLRETIEAVQRQTLKDIDIWVVNDGSTDASAGIAAELQRSDNRIHLINKKNTGVADSRNQGINHSTGTYVAFLDADDIMEATNLEEKVDAMKREHKEWAYSDLSFIDGAGHAYMREEKVIAEDYYRNLLKWEMVVPGPCSNIVAARQFMGTRIRFDDRIPCPSDRDICIQLARYADPVFVNKKLWRYRIHDQSMTALNKRVADEMAIMYEKYKKENYFPDRKTRRLALSKVYLIIASNYYQFTGQKGKTLKFLLKSLWANPAYFFKSIYRKLR